MAIKLFQFTFHVNSFIVNSGRLTHQNMIHSTGDSFIPVYFKGASEIFAWGPLSCLAVSLKQYNKDRNAGIVNQRRKFPLVLKEFFSANSKYRRDIFRSFISDASFPEYVPFFLSICQMYLNFIQSTWATF